MMRIVHRQRERHVWHVCEPAGPAGGSGECAVVWRGADGAFSGWGLSEDGCVDGVGGEWLSGVGWVRWNRTGMDGWMDGWMDGRIDGSSLRGRGRG